MPKYLKTGLTTVPQFFEQRYDEGTRRLVSIIVLLSYVVIMLPNILYAGAQVFVNIFGIDKMFGISRFAAIAIVCVATAIIGSIYAIFGGLKAIALSDSINGLGLIVGGLLLLALGYSPLKAYATIIDGSLGSKTFVRQTIKIAIPLLGCALAIAPCFKMHFWNIGAEGQITAGAIGATFFALKFGKTMPQLPLLLIMAAAAILCGGLWALIPAFFKAKWNTNETLFTLMMNYIAMQIVSFFCYKWSNPKGSGHIGVINASTNAGWFPKIGGQAYLLNIIIVAVLTVVMYIYLKYSKHGYEISVVGESENTARYIGINVKKVIMRTMLLSGAICGLSGLLLVAGTDHTVTRDTIAGRGFTAIMVSWLAKFNPIYMVLTSFLLVFLEKGADEISTRFGLNGSFSEILTGIIIFFIIGSEFFINYTIKFRESKKEASK